ncbi:E3 ubiquitin protein ligase RIE1-like [Coffea eugenioides]|uniref:E3 ubiquitin protein ligase RIE1-like n=1 Tax=Coffea eugenioides TaxID=49369 RepID=UPI000F5C8C61|nr:E3 ubiquitin protein ligase RIE1-like [Coffea arabica]XP_027179030.1 E3 ubiquitin protein ligase RIE1-like [Coffea eugenioides]
MDLENQQQGLLLLQNGHNSSSNNNTRAPTNIATTFSRLTSTTLNHHRIFFNDYDDDDEEEEREEHEDDCGRGPSLPVGQECPFSRPFVILDLIWNLGFMLVAAFVLLTTVTERPSTPLRLWVGGYALQCPLHAGFVWLHS